MKKLQRSIHRRDALVLAAACTTLPMLGCTRDYKRTDREQSDDPSTVASVTQNDPPPASEKEQKMKLKYLEIVTKNVDAVCELHAGIHGVEFGEPVQTLGGARTATLGDGSMIGIRAPMHDAEKPATRPYMLVDDIAAAIEAVKKSGGEIAVPAMELPGHGTIAVYILDGNEAGFWKGE